MHREPIRERLEQPGPGRERRAEEQRARYFKEATTITQTLHGIVRGRSIELNEDLDAIEGQEVEITVRPVPLKSVRRPGDGFLRTEGALADDPEWDAIMEEIYQARKVERRSPSPQLDER